jgi:hypothetical protein
MPEVARITVISTPACSDATAPLCVIPEHGIRRMRGVNSTTCMPFIAARSPKRAEILTEICQIEWRCAVRFKLDATLGDAVRQ